MTRWTRRRPAGAGRWGCEPPEARPVLLTDLRRCPACEVSAESPRACSVLAVLRAQVRTPGDVWIAPALHRDLHLVAAARSPGRAAAAVGSRARWRARSASIDARVADQLRPCACDQGAAARGVGPEAIRARPSRLSVRARSPRSAVGAARPQPVMPRPRGRGASPANAGVTTGRHRAACARCRWVFAPGASRRRDARIVKYGPPRAWSLRGRVD